MMVTWNRCGKDIVAKVLEDLGNYWRVQITDGTNRGSKADNATGSVRLILKSVVTVIEKS